MPILNAETDDIIKLLLSASKTTKKLMTAFINSKDDLEALPEKLLKHVKKIEKSNKKNKNKIKKYFMLINYGLKEETRATQNALGLERYGDITDAAPKMVEFEYGVATFHVAENNNITLSTLVPGGQTPPVINWPADSALTITENNHTIASGNNTALHVLHAIELLTEDRLNQETIGQDPTDADARFSSQLLQSTYNEKTLKESFAENGGYLLKMLAAFLIFQGGRYAETYVVMSQGQKQLEASALALQVMRVTILLTVRPLQSVQLLGAAAYGERNFRDIESFLHAGWAAAIILTIIASPLLLTSNLWLEKVFGQDPELSDMAGDFLKIYACAIPPLTLTAVEGSILQATNSPGIVALTELGSVSFGVLLSFLCIAGKPAGLAKILHIKPMGLNGLALSFTIQKWINFFLFKLYFLLTKRSRSYRLLTLPSVKALWGKTRLVFRKGGPLALQIGSEQLYLFIIALYAGMLGKTDLAQANILLEYLTAFSITGSMLTHLVTMQKVSEVRGRSKLMQQKGLSAEQIAANNKNVKSVLLTNAVLALSYAAIIATLFSSASKPLVKLYLKNSTHDREAVEAGMSGHFAILAICTIADTARNLVGGGINGLDDVTSPMTMSLVFIVLFGAGLGALLTFCTDLELNGALYASAIAYTVSFFLQSKILYSHYNHIGQDERPSCCTALFACNKKQPTGRPSNIYADEELGDEKTNLLPSAINSASSVYG